MKLSILALLAVCSLGCAPKKPVRIDPGIAYRVYVYNGSCKRQPDFSLICKAKFDPQSVRAK